jgi:exo-1,4-beta-D-glucosaminidase
MVDASLGEAPRPSPLVSLPGDRATIPGWHLQSTELAAKNANALSVAGIDVSDWHCVGSRGTVMAGLIESGVYTESALFFSNNLDSLVDRSLFDSPWFYREEFVLDPKPGQHIFLETHGTTPRADIFVNGRLLASKNRQVGSYGGHKYEITEHVANGANCILVQAYPTNYLQDFAMGFIDWNPYPPDNGTGVWRDIQLSLTREIAYISPIRVVTDLTDPEAQSVKVTVKTDVQNLKNVAVRAKLEGDIQTDDGSQPVLLSQNITLEANEARTISIDAVIERPKLW